MISVECPGCASQAEVDDVAYDLSYISVKCESCGKIFACGIRDWEIDGEQEWER